jgi:hypothetical protein
MSDELNGPDSSALLAGVRWPSNEMRSQIVPVVDDLCDERDRLTAERDAALAEVGRLSRENDFLRARAGNDAKSCAYCGLGADEQGKCELGFPGCSRADDQSLCREVGVAMERDTLRTEVERLRAELDKLPLTADRVRITPGMEVWCPWLNASYPVLCVTDTYLELDTCDGERGPFCSKATDVWSTESAARAAAGGGA